MHRGISVSVDGSHKKRGYGPENNPPEVLTLHERAGIGSAWKEPIPVQTYAYDEPEGILAVVTPCCILIVC